ncbi:hypothetical protein M9Y10_015677 [Tritrichomonas musculus]|uniref:Right handed beta helix domain-containing protein n=1 Tax=Tritrichomonas musculus TaxID=1915356 RepID=A0ABR2L2X3_9EUKA
MTGIGSPNSQITNCLDFNNNSNFTFSSSNNACSGIEIDSSSEISITNCHFYNNNNFEGRGSLYVHGGSSSTQIIEISRLIFESCIGQEFCTMNIDLTSVTLSEGEKLTFTDLEMINVSSITSGIYQIKVDKNIEFNRCKFEMCQSNYEYGGGSGGVITPTQEIIFNECLWINNYCSGKGGGIQHSQTDATNSEIVKFESCNFTGNKTPKHGGAICIERVSSIIIKACLFVDNTALYNSVDSHKLLEENEGLGGAIYIKCEQTTMNVNPTIEIESCKFISNEASDGHALYIEGGYKTVDIISFSENVFTSNGVTGSTIVSDVPLDLSSINFNSLESGILGSNPIKYNGNSPGNYENLNFSNPIDVQNEQIESSFYNCHFLNCRKNSSVDPSIQQYVLTIHCRTFSFIESSIEFEDASNAIGGICVDNYCNMTITDSSLIKCNYFSVTEDPDLNDQSAGIYYEPKGGINTYEQLHMQNVLFDCISGVSSRCFKMTIDCNRMTCDAITIQNCPSGGSICSFYFTGNADSCTFQNWKFISNTAHSLFGGGSGLLISLKESQDSNNITFINCQWERNRAVQTILSDSSHGRPMLHNGAGGACQLGFSEMNSYMNAIFDSCEFKNNLAEAEGGALSIQTTGYLTITNCTFEDNVANGDGGALFIDPDFINDKVTGQRDLHATISNSHFTSNYAADGSAMFITGTSSSYSLTDLVFINNLRACNTIYSVASDVHYLQCNFSSSDGISSRGIEQSGGVSITIEEVRFLGLRYYGDCSYMHGGALLLREKDSSLNALLSNQNYAIKNCVFEDCQNLYGSGGAIYVSNIEFISIFSSKFINCKSREEGTILFIDETVELFEINSNCEMMDNNDPEHHLIVTGANNFIFEEFILKKEGNNNAKLIKVSGGQDIIIQNILIEGMTGGITVEDGTKSVYIKNCTFSDCPSGNNYVIYIENDDCSFVNNAITFTEGLSMQGKAISITNNGDIEVSNNKFINCNPYSNQNNMNPSIYFNPPSNSELPNTIHFNYNLIEGITNALRFNLLYFNLVNDNFNIDHNIISNCKNGNTGGNGFMCFLENAHDLVIYNLTICECESGSGSGGCLGFWIIPFNNIYKKIAFVNCCFKQNKQLGTSGGGAFQMGMTSNAHFEMSFESCEFAQNSANGSGGALFICTDNSATINKCIFNDNHALGTSSGGDGNGGAIFLKTNSMKTVSIGDCNFTNNSDKLGDGTAIYILNDDASGKCSVNIDQGCRFNNNYDQNNKHNYAIHSSSPFFSILDSIFESNDVLNKCSSINFVGASIENSVSNTLFFKCYNDDGSSSALGIKIEEGVKSVDIQNCKFELCGQRHDKADKYFDTYTIYDSGLNTKIKECIFRGDLESSIRGPSIKILSYGTHEIRDCLISYPICTNRGAIFYQPSTGDQMEENFIFQDTIINYPEGTENIGCHLTIQNSELVDISNITIENSKLGATLIDCELKCETFTFDKFRFIDNSCNESFGGGPGIWFEGTESHVTFSECLFENNSNINGNGGGIQIDNSDSTISPIFTFEGCKFIGNSGKCGGGICIEIYKNITIKDCLFSSNQAKNGKGGAVHIKITNDTLCKVLIINNTFTLNSGEDGHAISIEGENEETEVNIEDNIFCNNYNSEEKERNTFVIETNMCDIIQAKMIIEKNTFYNEEVNHNEIHVYKFSCLDIDFALNKINNNTEKVYYPTNIFSDTEKFSDSKYFSFSKSFTESIFISEILPESSSFSQSTIFSASNKFSITNSFTYSKAFTSSNSFTNSETFVVLPKSVSLSVSVLISVTFIEQKSVSFSLSHYASNTFMMSYIENEGTYALVASETNYVGYFPYIIYYLSPSFIAKYITIPIPKKQKISQEQLIGIACGSASVFFLILGITIRAVRKKKQEESFDIYDFSYSENEEEILHRAGEKDREMNETKQGDIFDVEKTNEMYDEIIEDNLYNEKNIEEDDDSDDNDIPFAY